MEVQIKYPKQNEHITSNQYIIKISGIGCNNVRIAINNENWRQCYYLNNEWCYNWVINKEGKYRLKAECWNERGERMESPVVNVYYDTELPKEEEKPKEQEITAIKSDFMRAEVNFLQYPIGVLDQHFKGKTFTFNQITPTPNKGDIDITWKILGTDEYGLPGPTAVELDMAITKLISEQYEKTKEYSTWYRASYYELCKIMGKRYDTKERKIIKRDLKKLCTTSYESSFAFKQKEQDEKFPTGLIFRKYDSIILKDEAIPSQIPKEELTQKERETKKTEYVYIILSPVYLASLQAHYTKPVYYEVAKQLPSAVSKRIFQLLSLKFRTDMTKDPEDKDCINYNYYEFCGRLPLKIWTKSWQAKGHLKEYLDQLVQQGYLKKYVFEFDGQPDRWFIRFYPGAFAREELNYCAGQWLLWDFISKQKQLESERKAEEQNKQLAMELEAKKKQKEEENKRAEIRHQQYMAKFQALPAEEQEKLRRQAMKQILDRGIRRDLILSPVIEEEIVEILARLESSTVGASPQDNRAPNLKDSASLAPAGPES